MKVFSSSLSIDWLHFPAILDKSREECDVDYRKVQLMGKNGEGNTYGELTPLSFLDMLTKLTGHHDLPKFEKNRMNFLDYGSGLGNLVILAAASGLFKKAVGIEKVKERNDLALKIANTFFRQTTHSDISSHSDSFALLDSDNAAHDKIVRDSSWIFLNNFKFREDFDTQFIKSLAELVLSPNKFMQGYSDMKLVISARKFFDPNCLLVDTYPTTCDWGSTPVVFYAYKVTCKGVYMTSLRAIQSPMNDYELMCGKNNHDASTTKLGYEIKTLPNKMVKVIKSLARNSNKTLPKSAQGEILNRAVNLEYKIYPQVCT